MLNYFIVGLTIFILLSYTFYLYRKRLYIATMYWIAFFIVSFLLPVVFNKNMVFKYTLENNTYVYLDFLYLVMGIVFIFFNILSNKIKGKTKNHIHLKLSYSILKYTNRFFAAMSIAIILYSGTESLFSGSSKLIETNNLFLSFIISLVTFGMNLSSQLRLFYVKNRKQIIFTLINMTYALIFGLSFSFARRMVIYPIIISVCFNFIIKSKKPKMIKLMLLIIILITLVLPLMISIRTFGLNDGITNFILIISDYRLFKDYLSMSTDVSWGYSVAAKIIQDNIHINPLTLLKPITIFIPRSIWSYKPLPLSLEIVRRLNISDNLNLSIPVTIVGESFAYFGMIGIFIYGAFWGIVTSYLDKKIVKLNDNDNSFSIVAFLTVTIQVIAGAIRGDFATTLEETEMVILPFIIILYFLASIFQPRNKSV